MQSVQNLQKYFVTPSKERNQTDWQNGSDSPKIKCEKSLPKFNRKSESRLSQKSQKKKHNTIQQGQQRVCYISPRKNSSNQRFNSNLLASTAPSFSEVIHQFSLSNDEVFKFQASAMTESSEKCSPFYDQSCHSQHCKGLLQKKEREISNLNSELQRHQEQNTFQKQSLKVLQQKLKEYEEIHIYLLERETFISQILENNIKLNENLHRGEQEKRNMEDHFGVLLQEKLDFEREYERQSLEWMSKFKAKNEEIEKLFRVTRKLQEELSLQLRKEKQALRMSKQNIELPNKNQKTLMKSKSQNLFSQSERKASEFYINITDASPDEQGTSPSGSKVNQDEKENGEKLISTLQQKIKYSEIEIDVLKKLKQDSSTISKHNQALKTQNKKLLSRISYLSRKFSRRGKDSDSSLQLSLSPSHQ